MPFILTTGLIPPDQASPVVGMAGTGSGLADPPCQLRQQTPGPHLVAPSVATADAPGSHLAAPSRWYSGRLARGSGPAAPLAVTADSGSGTVGQGTPRRPGLRRRILQTIVLDDGSRHADTTHRPTLSGDELAAHRPGVAPEPLLPRRARAPVNVPSALVAAASGRADPQAV